MNIALLQYPLAWADKMANLHSFAQRLAALAGQADVAVLPEMFSTGFCTDRPDLAETNDGQTVQMLQQWADNYNIAITGSFLAQENGSCYNRAFFAQPHAPMRFADKRHLFSLGGEHDYFKQGNKRLIVDYKGVKFCILVCYDVRFPVWSRNASGHDYDVLVYVANFPSKRITDWDALLPARGVENQCYVCAVNCVGTDGLGLAYNGHSMLLDTRQQALVAFADGESGTRIGTIDVAAIERFRTKFPVWRDADFFSFQSGQ